MAEKRLFANRKIVIATMHEKERVIAPILEQSLGVNTIIPSNFNTDKFGTFTREIKRIGNQLEVARKKAYGAMELTKTNIAVASEGSFGEHPSIPFVQSNLELILFIDKENGYEIRGHYRTSKANIDGIYASSVSEVLEFAKEKNFPKHGLILRRTENGRFGIYKNIYTIEELKNQAQKMLSWSLTRKVFIETDMRAHRNPTRMRAIEKATENLLKNIHSYCPECDSPGFSVIKSQKGLLCSLCKLPTDLPTYDIYHCEKCNFSLQKRITEHGDFADPKYCNHCNP